MIRKAKENNFESILNVEKNSGHPFYEKYPKRKEGIPAWLKRRFSEKNNEFYVYVKKEIIAYIALKKEFPAPNSGEIICLSVLTKEQKKGIGKELVKFAEKRLEKLGFTRVFLYTGKENNNAQKFYEKLDYKKINEFPNYYGTGDTAILFGKILGREEN